MRLPQVQGSGNHCSTPNTQHHVWALSGGYHEEAVDAELLVILKKKWDGSWSDSGGSGAR